LGFAVVLSTMAGGGGSGVCEDELRESEYYVRSPRVVAVGKVQPIGDGDKPFLRWALDHDAAVRYLQDNPKRPGSKSWGRYESYKGATTLCEAVRLGAKSGLQGDVGHDITRGLLWFPGRRSSAVAGVVGDAALLAVDWLEEEAPSLAPRPCSAAVAGAGASSGVRAVGVFKDGGPSSFQEIVWHAFPRALDPDFLRSRQSMLSFAAREYCNV